MTCMPPQRTGDAGGAAALARAFVWLTDVAALSREDAAATIRSNALGLLRAATAARVPPEG
jgi:hypothetical protein